MLRNTVWIQLSILFTVSVVAVVTAGTVSVEKQKPKMILVPAITTADADISGGEVNVVTSNDSFARVRVSSNTSISRNGAAVAFDKIKRGLKITCKGNWDAKNSNVFNAAYVFIGGTVTESDVSDRVAAACRKIANKGSAHNASSTKRASASKEQPQLEVDQCLYYQCEWESQVSVSVKNLTNRPMTQLRATVHFLTKDGKYIVSSTPQYSIYGGRSLPPGGKTDFAIITSWTKDEYPEMPSKCSVEFSCVNQGDLRTIPAEVMIDAKPYGR